MLHSKDGQEDFLHSIIFAVVNENEDQTVVIGIGVDNIMLQGRILIKHLLQRTKFLFFLESCSQSVYFASAH